MKKEIIVSGVVGLLIGIIIAPFFFGMWGWSRLNWMPMMNSSVVGNIDRHFIEQMIPHHDDAILMAEIALIKAESPEIRTLAANIKRTQTEENAKMREWYKSWAGQDVPENVLGMGIGSGMMMNGGMMGNTTNVVSLESAKPFDKEFIEQMIPHHQMAIMMATMLLQGTEREEMKALGQAIIDAQSNEIDQMRSWYSAWYGN